MSTLDNFYKNAYYQGMLQAANDAGVKLANVYDDAVDWTADRIGDFDEYALGGWGKEKLRGDTFNPDYVSDLTREYDLNREMGQHTRARNQMDTDRAMNEMALQKRMLEDWNATQEGEAIARNARETVRANQEMRGQAEALELYRLQQAQGQRLGAGDLQSLMSQIPQAQAGAQRASALARELGYSEDPTIYQGAAQTKAVRNNAKLQSLLRQAGGAEERAMTGGDLGF